MKKPINKLWLVGIGLILFIGTLGFRSDLMEISKQLEIFTNLFKELHMNYVDPTDPSELMDAAIEGLLSDLDPYTHYWKEDDVENNIITSTGTYTGIGATVDFLEDRIVIVEVYKDYPADLAGLRAGDEIMAIGGTLLREYDQHPGDLLSGAPKSTVELSYMRQGKRLQTTLIRSAVEVKAVPFSTMINKDIGYIILSYFNRQSTEEIIDALNELKQQGARSIILDLRNNPGGLLSEAINVSNIFLPEGELVVSTKSAIKKYNQSYYTTQRPVDTEIPLVVLINERSASASEIVAGALQDLDRAVIVGARSFGKGLVQRPRDLSHGRQLKVTISRYYTPSGRGIHSANPEDEAWNDSINPADNETFTTRNGRKIQDVGGIKPDIEAGSSTLGDITRTLLYHNYIFDYATRYYYTHELYNLEDFSFTQEDFEDFKYFLEQEEFDYQSATSQQLNEVMYAAQQEGFQQVVDPVIEGLLLKIDSAKTSKLEEHKSEIIGLLSDEIIKRYFYREGLYKYHLDKDPEMYKAVEILEDSSELAHLLGVQE